MVSTFIVSGSQEILVSGVGRISLSPDILTSHMLHVYNTERKIISFWDFLDGLGIDSHVIEREYSISSSGRFFSIESLTQFILYLIAALIDKEYEINIIHGYPGYLGHDE
jgi:hypothetical protein